jgi:tryptophan synthase alpha chain
MKTYKQVFSELNRAALIPFFVIGDPDFNNSLDFIKTAIDAGADILELGIPFSDPIADGPTIQKADIRSLRSGMKVSTALDFIRSIKQYKDIPIGLLMYYNLVYQYGVEKFFTDFHDAGVNSVLIADLSINDVSEILPAVEASGMDTVFMVTPVTNPDRMQLISSQTTGFIYTVSVLGVTGSRDNLSNSVKNLVVNLKSITEVPVCVGFGVSKPEHACAIARAGADGVIIGSRIVKMIEDNLDDIPKAKSQIADFISEVKEAIDTTSRV